MIPILHRDTATPRGPVQTYERALAPDLARGAMLLPIAIANATGVVMGGTGLEPAPHCLEKPLNLLLCVCIHARAYPVFAVMFGYGLVQLATRQAAAGAALSSIHRILLRRSIGLFALGALHALLLYFGDFLGAYALMGVAAAFLFLRFERFVRRATLCVWAVSLVYVIALAVPVTLSLRHGSEAAAPVPTSTIHSLVAPDYVSSTLARIAEWPVHTATVLPAIILVLLGMLAARYELLERPRQHRTLLGWVATAGLAIAFLGGLPMGLASAGLFHTDRSSMDAIFRLHQASGTFGGPGYAALAGLAVLWLQNRNLDTARIIAALGQRSLTGYLFQSIAWMLLLAPYTLALGNRFNSPMLTGASCAAAVWIASLAGAWLMERRSYRGPAEIALRRFMYPNRSRSPVTTTPLSPIPTPDT